MKKRFVLLFSTFCFLKTFSQKTSFHIVKEENGQTSYEYYQPENQKDKYFEDQFYIGVQYIGTLNKTNQIESQSLPYSVNAGFIKDIPINKKRNIGFGLGAGYSLDITHPNIDITFSLEGDKSDINNDISDSNYITHNIEFPLEFRWRTSTASTYTFWRIYSGLSYIRTFDNKVIFNDKQNVPVKTKLPNNFNEENIAIYSSIGYGTWNFHVKYYTKPFFKSGTLGTNGTPLDYNFIKFGLMFYIL